MTPAALRRITGLIAALFMLGLDQGFKQWMLNVYDIADRQPLTIAPFFDIILTYNRGISYGMFASDSDNGRNILLVVTFLAVFCLAIWLWRSNSQLATIALSLIIGGAIGNGYDRFAYGGVADFFYFHFRWFSWYIFNVADCGIVLGVGLLLLEAMLHKSYNIKQNI